MFWSAINHLITSNVSDISAKGLSEVDDEIFKTSFFLALFISSAKLLQSDWLNGVQLNR